MPRSPGRAVADGRRWARKIQDRNATNRSTVASAFASTSTSISTAWLAPGSHGAERGQRAAGEGQARARTRSAPGAGGWRRRSRPRTPKVSRRLAAVLADRGDDQRDQVGAERAEPGRAAARRAAGRPACSTTPTAANRSSCPGMPAGHARPPGRGRSAGRGRAGRAARAAAAGRWPARGRAGRCPSGRRWRWRRCRRGCPGRRPSPPGTSWMRSPLRSASTSSSVSKNQPVSSTSGSSRRATSARMALKPHWASENRAASVPRRIRL